MKKSIIINLLISFFIEIAIGQTTNIGEVYVSLNTDVSFVDDFNNTTTGEFWNNGSVYSYRNWNNDGIVDFSIFNLDSGLTSFVGNESQIISGTNFNYLYNTLFDNSLGEMSFNLLGDISVSNESDFTFGIVDNKLSSGMFVFEQNAYHISVSNDSHINGDVIKVGDNSFDYPIGDSNYYRSASISAPSLNNDIFIGEYFYENTNNEYTVNNLGTNLTLVDNAEYWVIERFTGTSQVLVTLSWSNETTPSEILVEPLEAIHIARWDSTLQLWIDQGGVQDIINQSVSALVENYGVFTLARVKDNVEIDFPLFFTPNYDGHNDTWNVNQSENIEVISIHIFDRYGKLLKQISPNGIGWDGTYNGKRLTATDYWFMASYKDLNDNTIKQFRSHFSLKY
ncbi:gliding motility-associated C-terminal domain-containing protein [Flaviramulus basaltis]|uniref:Gliding motility-associated C-terminal domain-containing protein n=1 Tax=Flaviramulus basaltis TaxID=369401 RepID=A0A1K2IHG3_9FLAO|nr:T9SS type B sorting domain-containing protein [Flaviramulus basaltis]SFZ91823.1 gliding motility-associated C-terminal domain-containing protein [Flaviramulus basaltis]